MELTAKRTALLVGDTITVNCLARGSEILDDHWKYPGKLVSTHIILQHKDQFKHLGVPIGKCTYTEFNCMKCTPQFITEISTIQFILCAFLCVKSICI